MVFSLEATCHLRSWSHIQRKNLSPIRVLSFTIYRARLKAISKWRHGWLGDSMAMSTTERGLGQVQTLFLLQSSTLNGRVLDVQRIIMVVLKEYANCFWNINFSAQIPSLTTADKTRGRSMAGCKARKYLGILRVPDPPRRSPACLTMV